MNKFAAIALVLGASTVWGREPLPVPAVDDAVAYSAQEYAPQPIPQEGYVVSEQMEPGVIIGDATAGHGIPLYHNVKVVQARKMHPCAVPKIVSVPDPCNPCCCVFVQICVPPCACECVYTKRGGRRTVFDYGDYAVKVTTRGNRLVINYDN